ncbi:Magnesium transporter MRS2-8 [Tetrabaena socialis]|uniref:Magnesium transporter MRS2-8 n=1 Tax=Tetrabaena socialis TaxID=47790 RepID=A0A2J8ADP0_9CHLO|nr:Magnesium transporter MRS2-8 [Tetrabaena socialis]|eukprot:PNH10641.1 Magnesium transporter MRS2-8 [Tetrabaena socialis]
MCSIVISCQLEIPIRDMRLMDSALGSETLAQLLVRDNAMVFSMEHVRLIIMNDKVRTAVRPYGVNSREYIEDTEDLVNIQLDFSRNKLIRFDILITTGTFALAFFNIMTGMLGENLVLPDTITQDLWGFFLVNGGTMVFCITTFLTLVALFRWHKVL